MVIAHKLRKQYGNGKTACADLSLTIAKSECFGLLGPNGAGKTTTIGMLNGQMRPTSGCVFIRGKKVWFQNEGTAGAQDDLIDDIHFEERSSYSRRSHASTDREDPGRKLPLIGLCPQYDRLWPQMSAEEHLHFYGKIRGIDSSEMTTVIGRLLYTLNLNHSGIPFRPVHTYSGRLSPVPTISPCPVPIDSFAVRRPQSPGHPLRLHFDHYPLCQIDKHLFFRFRRHETAPQRCHCSSR